MQRSIDYIGVGVGAAIFNSEGKLFLTLRGKKAKKLPLSIVTKYDLAILEKKFSQESV